MKLVFKKNLYLEGNKVLVMGATFKENCPDIRNSKSIELIYLLESTGFEVHVYEPNVDLPLKFHYREFSNIPEDEYIGVHITVAHEKFLELDIRDVRKKLTHSGIIFDIKSIYPKEKVDWRL